MIALKHVGRPFMGRLIDVGRPFMERLIDVGRPFMGRQAIVCFEHGFHGRTNLAMALTSKVVPYKKGFGPFAPEVYRLPYPYCYRCETDRRTGGLTDRCCMARPAIPGTSP